MGQRRWNDFTRPQRVAIVSLACVQLALASAAWADLVSRPAEEVTGSKGGWALVIGVNFVGPLAYYRWGRRTTN